MHDAGVDRGTGIAISVGWLAIEHADADAGGLEAISAVARALVRAHPLDWKAYMVLAAIEQQRGRLFDAESALVRAACLAPRAPIAHARLGLLRIELGDEIGARRALRAAHALLVDRDGGAAGADTAELTVAALAANVTDALARVGDAH